MLNIVGFLSNLPTRHANPLLQQSSWSRYLTFSNWTTIVLSARVQLVITARMPPRSDESLGVVYNMWHIRASRRWQYSQVACNTQVLPPEYNYLFLGLDCSANATQATSLVRPLVWGNHDHLRECFPPPPYFQHVRPSFLLTSPVWRRLHSPHWEVWARVSSFHTKSLPFCGVHKCLVTNFLIILRSHSSLGQSQPTCSILSLLHLKPTGS